MLDGADAKTVKRYLQRYSYPSQLAMVMKLSDERLQQLRLGNWVRGKLNSLGLEKGDYIFLAEHASYNLYGAMMFLRKAVLELNRLLTAVDCSPLFTYPHDLWDGGGNDLTPINWEQELRNMTYQVAPEIINKMVLTEDEAIELVNLGSNSLIDAWLGANILREKAITYLDKKGIAFDAKAFVSDNIRRILRAKNINLSQYDL